MPRPKKAFAHPKYPSPSPTLVKKKSPRADQSIRLKSANTFKGIALIGRKPKSSISIGQHVTAYVHERHQFVSMCASEYKRFYCCFSTSRPRPFTRAFIFETEKSYSCAAAIFLIQKWYASSVYVIFRTHITP